MKKDRIQNAPTFHFAGFEIDSRTMRPVRPNPLPNLVNGYDNGADPIGDGMFRMHPSGDVVDLAERNLRLERWAEYCRTHA